MRNVLKFIALALACSLIDSSTALAAPNTTSGSGKTQKDLEREGYKCEVVSVGFDECRKGDSIYWCSGGVCQPKPFRAEPTDIRGPIISKPQKLIR